MKSYLLPYKYQKLGWKLICIFIGLLSLHLILYLGFSIRITDAPQPVPWILFLFARVFPYLALALICLSKEKNEDEFVQYIRGKVIWFIVVTLLVLGMFNLATEEIFPMWGLGNFHHSIVWWDRYLKLTPVTTTIYIILFKGMLFYNNYKSRKSGQ